VFNSFPADERGWHDKPYPAGLVRSTCFVPGDLLNDGTYFVQLFIVADQSRVLSRHDGLLSFTVLEGARRGTNWHGKWIGAVRPALAWKTELISPWLEADGGSAT
jgi:lipopolysaccharide transport system ATP-binding protein